MKKKLFSNLIGDINNVLGLDIKIDSIIFSSSDCYCQHCYTHSLSRLHELRSLSKYLVALCYGHLLYSNPKKTTIDINTPVWPKLLHKVEKYNNTINKYIDSININNLLIQSAGYNSETLLMSNHMSITTDSYLSWLATQPIEYHPGTKFVYSNAAYFLLSVFFQEFYGESIYEYAKKNIFKPLNIFDSKWLFFGEYCAGATGLSLSAQDFHKIARLAIDDGVYDGKELIAKNFIYEMQKNHIMLPENYRVNELNPSSYGYSFWCSDNNLNFITGANGQYMIVDPTNKNCITILSSSSNMKPILRLIKNFLQDIRKI